MKYRKRMELRDLNRQKERLKEGKKIAESRVDDFDRLAQEAERAGDHHMAGQYRMRRRAARASAADAWFEKLDLAAKVERKKR